MEVVKDSQAAEHKMDAVFFVSGHLNLTIDEFNQFYTPFLEQAMKQNCSFVIGDAIGADFMAQSYLMKNHYDKVVVYHMFETPRNNCGFKTKGGFDSDDARDSQMTRDSTKDICWVRKGKSKRISGTEKNILRRKNQTFST